MGQKAMMDDYGICDSEAAEERYHILHPSEWPHSCLPDGEIDVGNFVSLADRFLESPCEWSREEYPEECAV